MSSHDSDIATEEREHTGLRSDGGALRRVYVTGAGPVCPAGLGAGELSSWLWGERSKQQKEFPAVARVPEFDLADFSETTRPYVDTNSRLALASGALAFACSSGKSGVVDPARSGLVTATALGNMATVEHFQRIVREKGVRLASPVLFPHTYPNTTNSLMAIEFDLRGCNQNFTCDPLGGARSIQAGAAAIRSGLADLMLAGGADALTDSVLDTLRKEREQKPGPRIGEGACFLLLESEFSMLQRGSAAACELAAVASRGTGLTTAPQSDTDAEPAGEAVADAIAAALKEARLWKGDLGAVFLAMPRLDDPLSRAVLEGLGVYSQKPPLSLCETMADTFAASFPMECAAAALLLSQGAMPATDPKQEKKDAQTPPDEVKSEGTGETSLVLGWSVSSVVAAILKLV